MNPTCPKCGGETKLVPAGISKKSGKPYSAFYSCLDRGCGGTIRAEQGQPSKQIPSVLEKEEAIKYFGVVRGDIKELKELLTSIEAQIIGRKVEDIDD